MKPVIVALFDDYGIADRVRAELVAEGFPTDRLELTSRYETGEADAEPGDAFVARLSNYFHTLIDQGGRGNGDAEALTAEVRNGHSAIAVHPRTESEIVRARNVLQRHAPLAVEELLH